MARISPRDKEADESESLKEDSSWRRREKARKSWRDEEQRKAVRWIELYKRSEIQNEKKSFLKKCRENMVKAITSLEIGTQMKKPSYCLNHLMWNKWKLTRTVIWSMIADQNIHKKSQSHNSVSKSRVKFFGCWKEEEEKVFFDEKYTLKSGHRAEGRERRITTNET